MMELRIGAITFLSILRNFVSTSIARDVLLVLGDSIVFDIAYACAWHKKYELCILAVA